jgi:DNA-nicking Smr family endonuclease
MARRKEDKGGGGGAAPNAKEKPFFRPFAALARPAEKEKGAPGAEPAASKAGAQPAKAPTKPGLGPAKAVVGSVRAQPSSAAEGGGPEPSFADLLYGVKPLASKAKGPERVVKAAAEPAATAPDPSDEAVRAHLRGLVEGDRSERFEVSDDGRVIEGHRPEVDRSTLRRLRRGELPVDGRIDLHGLAAGAARESVEAFVRRARGRGDRVLLLVHGKGEHSPGGRGVLRGEIAAWLSQGEASRSVAAFATAASEDGGEGALYVLLRRA